LGLELEFYDGARWRRQGKRQGNFLEAAFLLRGLFALVCSCLFEINLFAMAGKLLKAV